MIYNENEGIKWLQFEIFAPFPELIHGVFLRSGGVSKPPYASLNLTEDFGDHPNDVKENLERIKSILGLEHTFHLQQIHGNDVVVYHEKDKHSRPKADASLTNHTKIGLMIQHADCQAAIFYDPVNKVIANAHAGWKGSAKNIFASTLSEMRKNYGTLPKDVRVAISPSLGPNHAEFINYEKELPEEFWKFQTKDKLFDFWRISEWQLTHAGVNENHIQISKICTYANSGECFSYRREKLTGRHGTVVALKQ